jgi:ribosomal protein S18 acetylase RimI-like enzyme
MASYSPMIRILHPGDEALVEAFLLPRLESSMFLVGNIRAAGLNDRGQRYEGTYAAAFDGDTITGVVAHYWNGNIIAQAPLDVAALSRAAVATSGRPIKGLIGPLRQVTTMMDGFGVELARIQVDETEYLYSLSLDALVEPDTLREGRVRGRRLAPPDLELAVEWRVAYSLEALGDFDTPELRDRVRAGMQASLEAGEVWMLEDEAGTPLAQSAFNAVTTEAVQVGGVWTPPALRGRGYGRAVVAASLRDARAEGKRQAILFTGVHNTPAQKAYIALGFQHIGDYRIVLLRESIPSMPKDEGR